MLLKISGSIFVILATTFMGIRKADVIKEEYRQMEYLKRLLSMLESEMRYARAHLGEIFAHLACHVKEPYREWLIAMQTDMNRRDCDTFERIWKHEIDSHLRSSGLPAGEIIRLKHLGEQIGGIDLKFQLRILEVYQNQLDLSMSEIWDGMKNKIRLCHCLGIMSGMLIAVLLF